MRPCAYLLTLPLILTGCTSPSPTVPSATASESAALAPPITTGDLAQSALALYNITLDPVTLQAEVSLADRGMMANDAVTDLEVQRFLVADSFTIDAVALGASTLDVTYTFRHPFAAPITMTPPGDVVRRADLGAAVRVAILADADLSSPTFFAGTGNIRMNSDLVANANGYLAPGGLFTLPPSFIANAVPYQVLVDEGLDNRNEVSNAGAPLGNFTGTTGWQTANINNGGVNNGWTGLGYLHQGQSATRVLQLNYAALGQGPLTFQVALLAKYAQPKIARAQKLPAAAPAVTTFGYRAYHGALDVEDVQFHSFTGTLTVDTPTLGSLYFKVRDWDARATATTLPNLKDDADATHISPAEAGVPTLEVSIPDVLGPGGIAPIATILDDDTGYSPTPDPGSESGVAGDEIVYSGTVLNTGGPGQTAGSKWGCVRAIDAEAIIGLATWHTALDETGALIGTPVPVTYQLFQVPLSPANGLIVTWGGTLQTIAYGCPRDASGDVYLIGNYNSTTDFDPSVGGIQSRPVVGLGDAFCLALTKTGVFRWVATWGGAGVDNVGAIALAPDGSVRIVGQYTGTVDFDPGPAVLNFSNAGGRDAYCLALGSDGTFLHASTWGGATDDLATAIAISNAGEPRITGIYGPTADFDPSGAVQTRTAVTAPDAYCLALDPAGAYQWVATAGGPGEESSPAIALTSLNEVRLAGSFLFTVDFNPGAGVLNRTAVGGRDSYLWSLTPGGLLQSITTWGGAGDEIPGAIALTPSREPRIVGTHTGTADFDPGPAVVSRVAAGSTDSFCLALDNTGAYQWVAGWGSGGFDAARNIKLTPTGAVRVCGPFTGTTDFDPSAGLQNRASNGGNDSYLLALTPGGTFEWVATWGGLAVDDCIGLSLDSAGAPVVAGAFQGTVDFDPGPSSTPKTSAGLVDGYLLGLKADGTF